MPTRRLIIAVDYDFTYTADTHLFTQLIVTARLRGHTVICVTGRNGPISEEEVQFPPGIPMVYAGERSKRLAALEAGYQVDIWIDDCPESIEIRGS